MKKEPAKVTVPHRDSEPNYYCVKTTFHFDGKIESEILTEENSDMLIAFESPGKPLDGVFETATATIYYTYHDNYADAARQVEATGIHNGQLEHAISMTSYLHSCRHLLTVFFLPEVVLYSKRISFICGFAEIYSVLQSLFNNNFTVFELRQIAIG